MMIGPEWILLLLVWVFAHFGRYIFGCLKIWMTLALLSLAIQYHDELIPDAKRVLDWIAWEQREIQIRQQQLYPQQDISTHKIHIKYTNAQTQTNYIERSREARGDTTCRRQSNAQ